MSILKNKLSIGIMFFSLFTMMGTFEIFPIVYGQSEIGVPGWIKNNAGWWAEGVIDDDAFVQGIQFLIKEGIMDIPPTVSQGGDSPSEIPGWIKNNAGWWAEGVIDDDAFVQGIQFLIKEGIMDIPPTVSPNTDSDNDGILDNVDDCPNSQETINGFEDSDGCPDVVPLPNNSLTIINSNLEVQRTGGWSDTIITLEWTYFVEHVDNDNNGIPKFGHFVVDITGFASGVGIANHVQGNEFSGSTTFTDDACSDGEFVIEIQSFIGDDGGNYQGDGDIIEKSIPPCRG